MAKREYNGEPIDLTESYEWTANNNDAGKTVGGSSPDDEGEMNTDYWPSEAPPRRELNEDQIKVVEAAANPTKTFDSLQELSRVAVPERSDAYANLTLRDHWPDGHEKIKKSASETGGDHSNGQSGGNENNDNNDDSGAGAHVDTIRERLVSGETSDEVSGDFDCTARQIQRIAKNTCRRDIESDTPPVVYDASEGGWVWEGGDAREETGGEKEVVDSGDGPASHRVDEIRQRLISGESAVDIADEIGCHVVYLRNLARGAAKTNIKSDTAPVEWDASGQKWQLATEKEGQEEAAEDKEHTDADNRDPQPVAAGGGCNDADGRLKTAVAVLVAFVLGWVIGR